MPMRPVEVKSIDAVSPAALTAAAAAKPVVVKPVKAATIKPKPVAPAATIDADIILAKYKSLTPKEREIALLLANNLSNKEISSHLCIGISTVKTHINNIYNKLFKRH